MNIENAIEEFKKYTKDYLEYGNMIKLKINHTLRVVTLCKTISEKLNLNEEDTHIAMMIGLLHDLGRFEQWKNYETFKDLDSIDHAELAIDILTKDNYIRKYIKDDKYDQIIIKSIKYHNKFTIPKNMNKREKLFAKIIRDADKIDILYLYTTKEIDLELDENAFTDIVYKTLLEHGTINRKDIKTKTDRLSVSLGFIYDINFKDSFKYLKDKNYMNIIVDIYIEKTNNKKLKEQLEELRKEINNYIEVKLC